MLWVGGSMCTPVCTVAWKACAYSRLCPRHNSQQALPGSLFRQLSFTNTPKHSSQQALPSNFSHQHSLSPTHQELECHTIKSSPQDALKCFMSHKCTANLLQAWLSPIDTPRAWKACASSWGCGHRSSTLCCPSSSNSLSWCVSSQTASTQTYESITSSIKQPLMEPLLVRGARSECFQACTTKEFNGQFKNQTDSHGARSKIIRAL